MFRRKITEEIFKWKNSTGKKKALVLDVREKKSVFMIVVQHLLS